MAETESVAVVVDYSTMTKDQLFEELGQAYSAKNMKLMAKLSILVAKAEASEEKAKKDLLLAELKEKTVLVQSLFDTVKNFLTGGGQPSREATRAFADKLHHLTGLELEGADGIWYAADFGSEMTNGIPTTTARLSKGASRKAGEGVTAGKSSYKGGFERKPKELLVEYGELVMFDKDTLVTIDKVEHTMQAGMTLAQAYAYSTNGGWRNKVAMALYKVAGLT